MTQTQTSRPLPTPDEAARATETIRAAVETVIEGKSDVIRLAITVLLAEGHLLIEDVPGVGKTMLAKALARSVECSVRRIQFTPDLLPSDVTGVSVFHQERQDFEFKPGPVFANIVVGDEINRAGPKTQSALLESMEERQVTVDGTTYRLHPPFLVVATQNPLEMEGTFPLPEAQRDRFMARVSMGYPGPAAELQLLDHHANHDPLSQLTPVATADDIRRLITAAQSVYASEAIKRYVVALVGATRTAPELLLGASPRASLHLLRAARAFALVRGRDHVLPDDVQDLLLPVLAHRLLPRDAPAGHDRRTTEILNRVVSQVPIPGPASRS